MADDIYSDPSAGAPGSGLPGEPPAVPGHEVPAVEPYDASTQPVPVVPYEPTANAVAPQAAAAPQPTPPAPEYTAPADYAPPAGYSEAPAAAGAPVAPSAVAPGAVTDGGEGSVAAAEGGSFFSKPVGRAVLIGGAVAALLLLAGIAAAVALVAFGMFGSPTPAPSGTAGKANGAPPASGPVTGTAGASDGASDGATTAASTASPQSVAIVTNADIYTVRDPFIPLIKVPTASSATSSSSSSSSGSGGSSTTSGTSGGGSSTTTSTTADPDTLTLEGIVTEDGVRKAKLSLGGKTYTLAAGEQVDGTAWEVLEVGSDSVVMLYGDERITLTVGQGITK